MKVIQVIYAVLVIISIIIAAPKTVQAEDRLDSDMTKWGPKLSEEQLAAIAKLSTSELVEMLKEGDTLHAYAARNRLKAGAGWKKNFDLLLSIAAERRGDIIVEGLVGPMKTSVSAEEKRMVDKFLDFLENELKKEKPSVSRRQAVRSIAKTVFFTAAIRPVWGPYRVDSVDPNDLEVPYANARVVSILSRCLNNKDWRVRSEAVRGLSAVGANDLAEADNVVTLLDAQLAKEEAGGEKEKVKAKMKKAVQNSLRRLNREINWFIKARTPEPNDIRLDSSGRRIR